MQQRSFLRYFMGLALPVILQQLLAHLLAMSDTIMLGAFSEDAISAVSVANKYFFIYNLVIFGLSNGVGLFISQYHVALQKENENRTLRFGLRLCVYTAIIFMVILLVFPSFIMSLFVKNEVLIRLGNVYNGIVVFSYLPYALAQMLGVGYRVIAQPRIPMYAGCLSFLLNIALNYALIFGHFGFPSLGVAGAGIATLCSRIVEALFLCAVALRKESEFYLLTAYTRFSLREKYKIAQRAIPLVCNEFIWSLGLSLIFMNYCAVDERYIPALTVVDTIASMIYVAFSGCSAVTGVVIGNDLGAGKLKQAKLDAKKMIRIGLSIYIVGCALVLCTSPIAPFLFSLQGESRHMAMQLLMIKACITWTQGYSETIYYILRAGGDTRSVLCIDGLFTCFGPLLLSTLCARVLHIPMLWMFAIVEGSSIFKIFIATWFYRKETWLKNLTERKHDLHETRNITEKKSTSMYQKCE
ncbi:MATE family efflux transporter [Longicatena caecimuris]|uniref:MATE family efflux transporter n=1 Tax=Longicatena caecimuris TaxID=1796635 RepID=UPI0018AC3B2D|nr:MATE family efflux transporter [Longicatena caecimuris]